MQAGGVDISPRMETQLLTPAYHAGKYVLPPLPYPADALAPYLDEATLLLHHDKHHAAYVAGANEAAATLQRIAQGEASPALAPAATLNLAFNLSGHLLHTLYWENLAPLPQSCPDAALADAIITHFDSWEGFQRVFRAATMAVQGSGWGILGVEPASRRLVVCAVQKHQDALIPGMKPLLVCDVWEHAYYLHYRNDRSAYLDAFFALINWEVVASRYRACCHVNA